MKRQWARILTLVVVSNLGACAGGFVGAVSLNVRARLYGPNYSSARYDDVGGGIREIVERLIALWAGGFVGLRLGWLLASLLSVWVWKKSVPLGRPGRVDLLLLPLLLLWGYLVYASW